MSHSTEPRTATARSPIAGCTIFLTILLVMFFLLVFSGWVLFRQFEEIETFTSDKPAPVAVEETAGKEQEIAALTAKLTAFQTALEGEETVELSLSPQEINLAIAAYQPFEELRSTFRVLGGEGDTLKVAISFPMNGKPRLTREGERGLLASDPRYLIGSLTARPLMLKKELVLEIPAIDVPGNTKVPPGFIQQQQFSPYRITERYTGDKTLGPAMAKLTSARAENGHLILRRGAGEVAKDHISHAEVNSARNRLLVLLGIAATVFLIFAAIVLFIGFRAKSRKN